MIVLRSYGQGSPCSWLLYVYVDVWLPYRYRLTYRSRTMTRSLRLFSRRRRWKTRRLRNGNRARCRRDLRGPLRRFVWRVCLNVFGLPFYRRGWRILNALIRGGGIFCRLRLGRGGSGRLLREGCRLKGCRGLTRGGGWNRGGFRTCTLRILESEKRGIRRYVRL